MVLESGCVVSREGMFVLYIKEQSYLQGALLTVHIYLGMKSKVEEEEEVVVLSIILFIIIYKQTGMAANKIK